MKFIDYKNLIEVKNYDERAHQREFLTNNAFDNSVLPFVLGAGTSSGKGPMAVMYLELFYKNPLNKNKFTLFVSASKTVLRDNIEGVIKEFNPSFTYSIVKDKKSLLEALSKKSQVIVLIPQTIKNYYSLLPKVHNFILDEAHEWYFAKTKGRKQSILDKIIKHIKPTKQLLLTGTPSKFVANGDKFNFQFVPVMDLYDAGLVSNVKVEVVSSTYEFKANDWLGTYGNLKSTKTNSAKQSEDALYEVCKEMIDKLKNPLKEWYNVNNITKHSFGKLFKFMDKTIIYTHSKKQADKFYKILNEKRDLKGKVLLSHSENDPDSIEFNKFKTDENYHILIAVDRGRIGFDMPKLRYIIDFTMTQNLDMLLQMYGRLLRKDDKIKNKTYFKVATKNTADYFVDLMTAMLCLTTKEYYSKYNGKNMGGIRIPKVLTKSIRNKQYQQSQSKTKSNKVKPYVSLTELGIPLDLNFFRQSILHTSNGKFNTIAETTLDDVRREFFELNGKIWNRDFLSFEEAREYVHSLGLKNQTEWFEYATSKDRHPNIPSTPAKVYKDKWINTADWLGNGYESMFEISDKHLSYKDAKKYIKKYKFKSHNEYKNFIIQNKIDFLPKAPKTKSSWINSGEWKGYSDYFGTEVIANQNKNFLSYNEAKKFVHTLKLKNRDEWNKYKKSGKKPSNIANDTCVYGDDWKCWGDFLGNGKEKGWQKIKHKK
jgi:superfamily II DNA or RNA helicase